MLLQGSCHCGAVRYRVTAHEPVPFMRCYCSICRKTAGSGGFAINLGADRRTLEVEGEEHLSVYRARMPDGSRSPGERNFCRQCGTALWMFDPRWPDLLHPHAGAVDTPLPAPPAVTHMMLGSRPHWVEAHIQAQDDSFQEYPKASLAEWHERHGLTSP
ncbi:GFA family protein [Acidovorax sp. FG27]|uniref:GFA family protein n=1 Tax=Acidovorax sp. FG27 TaxID=3133652 RepID=UPI0030E8E867